MTTSRPLASAGMERRPLPDDVARTARAHLAALLPPDHVSDAWHDLLAEVAYWGESATVPVLRLAHQVVLQHQPVTPAVAAHSLVEAGVHDPDDVAAVLDTDADRARALLAEVSEAVGEEGAAPAPPTVIEDAAVAGAPAPVEPDEPARPVVHDSPSAPEGQDREDREGDATATSPSVRIGFDEDEEAVPSGGAGNWGFTMRRLLVAAAVLWFLVVLVWAFGGNGG